MNTHIYIFQGKKFQTTRREYKDENLHKYMDAITGTVSFDIN